jgi:hypothetical protein
MPLIDIGITQGDYWKGSGKGGGQIGYWMYLIFVVVFGLLGLDHLLLRSPMTFLLKLLTMIPLLGFWWIYDIAQVTGEWDLVKEHGIGIPFYGPMGIGKGMFINEKGTNLSPLDTPRPWLFVAYVLLTLTFFVFPLNKIVVGDYTGAFAQLLMYFPGMLFFGVGIFLAMGWGAYDLYRIFFDTRGVLEKGVARIPPATWWPFSMNPYAKKGSLGPRKDDPVTPGIIEAVAGIPLKVVNAYGSAVEGIGKGAGMVGQATGAFVASGIGAANEMTAGVASSAAKTVQGVTEQAGETAIQVIQAGQEVAVESAGAVDKLVELVPKISKALDTASAVQKGGSMITTGSSSSASVLLFSVGLLAACGYVMYAFRKTEGGTRNDGQDDSPPDPDTVRKPSQASR